MPEYATEPAVVTVEKPEGKSKTFESATIKKSDNGGVIVECRYRMKQKAMQGPWPEPETLTYDSAEKALEALGKILGE